jgi:uncharacterized membrane protein YphA (DoxX/SURF4 family)
MVGPRAGRRRQGLLGRTRLCLLGGVTMATLGSDSPSWVAAILGWRSTWLAARIVLTAAYVYGGFVKLLDFHAAIAEQEHFGLHPGWFWAAIAVVVELGGSALVISGRLVWLGAGALGVLTAIATLVANDFWHAQGGGQVMLTNTFLEHLGLIAGFVLVAIMSERAVADVSVSKGWPVSKGVG